MFHVPCSEKSTDKKSYELFVYVTDATRRAQKLLKPYQPGKTNINHFWYDIYGKVTKVF